MLKSGINIFKLCLFINFLYADYFLSFSFTSLNNKIVSYELNCARAMTNKNVKKIFLFKFSTPYHNVKEICKYQSQILVDKLMKLNSFVYSNEVIKNDYHFRIKLTFIPKRFDIIIKNQVAYFYLKD